VWSIVVFEREPDLKVDLVVRHLAVFDVAARLHHLKPTVVLSNGHPYRNPIPPLNSARLSTHPSADRFRPGRAQKPATSVSVHVAAPEQALLAIEMARHG
jgi:hypothetical protein